MTPTDFLFSVGARREVGRGLKLFVTLYAACLAVWVIWAATLAIIDPLALGAIFLSFMLGLMFPTVAATARPRRAKPPPVDYLLAAASMACGVYFILASEAIVTRISLLDPLSAVDIFFGTALWLLTMEATRRAVGLALTMIVAGFVVYNLWGHHLGGVMSHGYISYEHFLDQTVFTTNGIFGAPIRVAATYAFLFVTFGVFLQRVGGSDFFFNIAAAVSGRSPGGPAKVAVASSALYGTISGSPTSDVVTTGAITIPMMRKLGYSPVLAGAVEVAASTGGGIMPPVMGSAAFIMVEITGIDYQTIVLAAVIPALLYYVGIYAQVHLCSLRLGLRGMSPDEIPALRRTLREGGVFVVPLAVIVIALLMGYTPTFVAVYATIAAIAVATIRAATRIGPKSVYEGLAEATLRMVPVTAACAAAGLVVGGISLTGLSGKFAHLVFLVAGTDLFLTLVVAGALCIVLGMGMPTPSAYIMAAVLVAETLVELGVGMLTTHMFLLFFAVLSAITPPVAVAAYAASSIAQANPLLIASSAVRLGLTAFVMPFAFVFGPELLAQGSWPAIGHAVATAVPGVLALAAANEGYICRRLSWWRRLPLGAGGICLMVPETASDGVGAALILAFAGRDLWAAFKERTGGR